MARGRGNKAPGQGMSKKQLKRKKPINESYLLDIEPLTDNQEIFFDQWAQGKNMFGYGAAGTGKTFIALYLALQDILDENSPYEKLYIVRSCLLYTSPSPRD